MVIVKFVIKIALIAQQVIIWIKRNHVLLVQVVVRNALYEIAYLIFLVIKG